jgi:hypothetical protein
MSKRIAVVGALLVVVVVVVVVVMVGQSATRAQQTASDGPQFVNGANLARPANYREWVFIGSSVGLTYQPPSAARQAAPPFGNVFVNPAGYRGFMETGRWRGSIHRNFSDPIGQRRSRTKRPCDQPSISTFWSVLVLRAERWGIDARRRYEALLFDAIQQLAADPDGSLTRDRRDIGRRPRPPRQATVIFKSPQADRCSRCRM